MNQALNEELKEGLCYLVEVRTEFIFDYLSTVEKEDDDELKDLLKEYSVATSPTPYNTWYFICYKEKVRNKLYMEALNLLGTGSCWKVLDKSEIKDGILYVGKPN